MNRDLVMCDDVVINFPYTFIPLQRVAQHKCLLLAIRYFIGLIVRMLLVIDWVKQISN